MTDARLERRARALSHVLAVVATGIGGCALAGWLAGIEELKSVVAGRVAMKTNTAVCLLACGLVLLAVLRGAGGAVRRIAVGAALGVCAVGLATGLEWAVDVDLGLDELLADERLGAVDTMRPNRMAPNTALAFLILGAALAMILKGREGARVVTAGGPLATAAAAFVALLGYACGVYSFYGMTEITQMAIPTALALLALSVGTLAARPDLDPVRLLVSPTVGGVLARRLLPAAVLVPAVLAAARLGGQDLGLYGTRVGAWLFALAMVGLGAPAVWRLARSIDGAERERAQTAHALRQAREHADRDALTGLFNRRRFDAELERFAEHARRYGLPGALVAVDLDGFKAVNDRHGHAAGDLLLRAIADALADCVRETDVVARLGGDEFAVLLPYCDPPDAARVGESVLAAVRGAAAVREAQVTASVGVIALTPSDLDTAKALADQAMYRAKHAGGDRLAVAVMPPLSPASSAG